MDFTLALTHFCEVHGPKSVLCTQVLPLECALCLPPSPPLRAQTSVESFRTQVHDSTDHSQHSSSPYLEHHFTSSAVPTDFSTASTAVDSEPDSPAVERHPLIRATDHNGDIGPQYRYGRAQGETCASCSFSVPQNVLKQLPTGAPGSFKSDGKSKNGAPVLRSKESVCLTCEERRKRRPSHIGQSSSQESRASSLHSFDSSRSHSDCHRHDLTYLTSKSPDNPESYAQLRASVIRALSCELLPKGMSDGPLCFGNPESGYTIAYKFRLTDPKARGRRRAYAFVALAGKDANRAFKACPFVWEKFSTMAKIIEETAQRYQDQQQKEEEADKVGENQKFTPASSFLTQRAVDSDGQLRRVGQTQPRSLAEIVGNENIFAMLHQFLVMVLRRLGDRFGGLPLADRPSVYQTSTDEEGISPQVTPLKLHTQTMKDTDQHRRDEKISTSQNYVDEIDMAKAKINRHIKRSSQCAPLTMDATAQRQVVA